MRSLFTIFLLVAVIISSSYFYYTLASVCRVPITYQIGQFDERFGISREEARIALSEAESVFEDATGRNLFIHSEEATVKVNFIFDDRQERTIAEEALRQSLDQKESKSEQIGQNYEQLKSEYEKLRLNYEKKVSDYDRRLDKYNVSVESYNASGGAPATIFTTLKAEEKVLSAEASKLRKLESELKILATKINEVGESGNILIEQYNNGVATYNQNFTESTEFTQGDYRDKTINIYTFKDQAELVRVLAHEFGHALGLDHVENKVSIMYYLMDEQGAKNELSLEDKTEFVNVCGDGTGLSGFLQNSVFSKI